MAFPKSHIASESDAGAAPALIWTYLRISRANPQKKFAFFGAESGRQLAGGVKPSGEPAEDDCALSDNESRMGCAIDQIDDGSCRTFFQYKPLKVIEDSTSIGVCSIRVMKLK